MKVTIKLPKAAAKLVKRLHRTGLYGITLEETARYMLFRELERHLARGGLLHKEPKA